MRLFKDDKSVLKREIFACEANGTRLRGGGHKRVDTCGFHPLVNHPFPLDSLAQIADM